MDSEFRLVITRGKGVGGGQNGWRGSMTVWQMVTRLVVTSLCGVDRYWIKVPVPLLWTSQVAAVVKNLPANAGDTRDLSSILGSGRSSGVGNGNPLQYSCLGNPMDWRNCWATVYGITKNWLWLSAHPCLCLLTCLFTLALCLCLLLVTYVPAQSCLALCSPMSCNPPGSFVSGISQATGVGCHFLLQEIFSTQGSNPCLLSASLASAGRFLTSWSN